MIKVLITGDSHISSLYRGYQKIRKNDACEIVMKPFGGGQYLRNCFFEDEGEYMRITEPKYTKSFKRFPPVNEFDFYGLSMPLHSARIFRHPDWACYAPSTMAVEEVPLSEAVVKECILSDQAYVLKFTDNLVKNGNKVFVIEPPRPFRHHPAFEKIREDVVLYVDNLYRALVSEELVRRGVKIVYLPGDVVDEMGYMKDKYRHSNEKDAHHGNELLGELIMEKVVQLCCEWGNSVDGFA